MTVEVKFRFKSDWFVLFPIISIKYVYYVCWLWFRVEIIWHRR